MYKKVIDTIIFNKYYIAHIKANYINDTKIKNKKILELHF